MYRVPELRTMLTFINEALKRSRLRPGLLSSNPTGVKIRQTEKSAPLRTEFYYHLDKMHIVSFISCTSHTRR